MDCQCNEYECIDVSITPCSNGAKLNIEAPFTGVGTFVVFFLGSSRTVSIEITEGDNVVLPTEIFNEDYVHLMKLYNGDNLEMCYKVNTSIAKGIGTVPLPQYISYVEGKSYIGNGTNTQSFNVLNGKTLLTVIMNGQAYSSDFWVHNGTTVQWKDNNVNFDGVIILNWL